MAVSPLAFDPEADRQGLTRAQYDAMVEAGLLDGEPVQLLEGELVRTAPQGWDHARTIDLIALGLGGRLQRAHGDARISSAMRNRSPSPTTASRSRMSPSSRSCRSPRRWMSSASR